MALLYRLNICLKKLITDYSEINIDVFLSGCSGKFNL